MPTASTSTWRTFRASLIALTPSQLESFMSTCMVLARYPSAFPALPNALPLCVSSCSWHNEKRVAPKNKKKGYFPIPVGLTRLEWCPYRCYWRPTGSPSNIETPGRHKPHKDFVSIRMPPIGIGQYVPLSVLNLNSRSHPKPSSTNRYHFWVELFLIERLTGLHTSVRFLQLCKHSKSCTIFLPARRLLESLQITATSFPLQPRRYEALSRFSQGF